MSNQQKPIFLSHSYHDKDLAEKLISLLTNGCDVSRNDILCTSLSGMNIKVGTTSFVDYLREQLNSPTLVILLITENYLASSFCLAELGATWRMGIPYFPLAVPPISRSGIGGVLEVTQAGDITNGVYLDQLRDKILELLGSKMSTDGWNVQKDIFLNGLDALIKGLRKPDLVQRAEFDKVQGQYKYALDSIKVKDGELRTLNERMAEMAKLKDAEAMRTFEAKYSSADKEFSRLCGEAKEPLTKLKRATWCALFWELRGEHFVPEDREDWDDVHTAESFEEVWCQEGESYCNLKTDHPRVQKAQRALENLKHFLENLKDENFFERFEEEHEFPASVGNREFWRKFLSYV